MCGGAKLQFFSSFTQISPGTFNRNTAIRFCPEIWAFCIATLFILCQCGSSVQRLYEHIRNERRIDISRVMYTFKLFLGLGNVVPIIHSYTSRNGRKND